MWSERYWHEYQYDENRPKTPEFLADFSFASAEHQWLEFVNLVSGRQDAPEFCLAGEEETRADKVAFEKFLDSHFPRGKEKFRELRRALDLLARGKITMMAAKPYSPIQNYPFLLERGMEFFTRGKTPIQGNF
jgi:hypothetical protein